MLFPLLKMDITVSEMMSNFMDSPLVVWVSHKDTMAPAVFALYSLYSSGQ